MIDQQAHAAAPQRLGDRRPLLVGGEDLDEPVDRPQPVEEPGGKRRGYRIGLVDHEVEARADDAVVGQVAQALVVPAGLDHRDALEAPAVALDRIEHRRVVRAVAARLDQQGMLDAVFLERGAIEIDRALLVGARLVAGAVVEGEPAMIDDVGMAIDPALAHDFVASRRTGPALAIALPVAASNR